MHEVAIELTTGRCVGRCNRSPPNTETFFTTGLISAFGAQRNALKGNIGLYLGCRSQTSAIYGHKLAI